MQVTTPPVEFDHPYDGPVIERVLSLEDARQLCESLGNGLVDGCAVIRTQDRTCIIVVPLDGPDPIIAHYEQHEIAHCNGWRH
jgi:hypothetical protein